MKRIKKILSLLAALCLCLFAVAGCGEEPQAPTPAVQLAAPVVEIEGNRLTWAAIENASGYTVYESGKNPVAVSATAYTISQTTPGTYLYTVYANGDGVKYTRSKASNAVQYTVQPQQQGGDDDPPAPTPTPLEAPVLSLQDGVLTWEPVLHAQFYEVYQNNVVVARQQATSYAITVTEAGSYVYQVKALSYDEAYTASPLSNQETYEVVPDEPLSVPAVAFDEGTKTLSWAAIPHADRYEIYRNDRFYTSTENCTYVISDAVPGTYRYKVRAVSDRAGYLPSGFSQEHTLTVSTSNVTFTVNVTVPDGYEEDTVTVAFYDDLTELYTATATVDPQTLRATATFEAINDRTYIARVKDLPEGYASSKTELSAAVTSGAVNVVALTSEAVFQIGSNQFSTIYNAQDPDVNTIGVERTRAFVAPETGIYTLDARSETKRMMLAVGEHTLIDTQSGYTLCSFKAYEGEAVPITYVGEQQPADPEKNEGQTYKFTISQGEPEVPLTVGSGYGDRANYLPNGEWTRKLTIETPQYYVISFGPSLNGRNVTITIGGEEYLFTTDVAEDEEMIVERTIFLDAGEYDVTIQIEGDDREMYYVSFFIYQQKA